MPRNRQDFAERFQDIYCQRCGRRTLSKDETRVVHDPRYCRAESIGVHFDTKNGGRWETRRFGGQDFYPRLLNSNPVQYGRCICDEYNRVVPNCHCEKWKDKREKTLERLNRKLDREEKRKQAIKALFRQFLRWVDS